MRRTYATEIVWSLLFLFVASIVSYAQSGADLSGTWRLDEIHSDVALQRPAENNVPAPPPPPRPLLLRISHSDAVISIDQVMPQGVETLTFFLDGTESANWRGPIQVRSKASWEGSTLVLSSVNSLEQHNLGISRESYTRDGESLIFEAALNRPDGTIATRRLVFVRQP